jgi:hypothetical protein
MNEDSAKIDRSWGFSWTLAKKVGMQKEKIAELEFENGEIGFNLQLKSDKKVKNN